MVLNLELKCNLFAQKIKQKKNQMLKVEGDGIESMLPFKIYSTLPVNLMVTIVW